MWIRDRRVAGAVSRARNGRRRGASSWRSRPGFASVSHPTQAPFSKGTRMRPSVQSGESRPTSNTQLASWVDEMARMLKPDKVVWCDGSADEKKRLLDEALAAKVLIPLDRKSTRLNSSHMSISYAVFCLKNKRIHHGAQ